MQFTAVKLGLEGDVMGQLQVGDKIAVEGRIQSREYRKYNDEGEPITKTAYEVSVIRMEEVL